MVDTQKSTPTNKDDQTNDDQILDMTDEAVIVENPNMKEVRITKSNKPLDPDEVKDLWELEEEIDKAIDGRVVPQDMEPVTESPTPTSIQNETSAELEDEIASAIDLTDEAVEYEEGMPEELEGIKLEWLSLPFNELRTKLTPPLNPTFHAKSGNEDGEELYNVEMLKGSGNKVSVTGLTYSSMKKPNQDAYLIAPGRQMIVDGMGGYAGGEVAANISVLVAAKAIEKNPEISDKELIQKIDAATRYVAKKNPKLKNMGAVVILANQPEENKVEFTYTGDPRGLVVDLEKGVVKHETTPRDGIYALRQYMIKNHGFEGVPTEEQIRDFCVYLQGPVAGDEMFRNYKYSVAMNPTGLREEEGEVLEPVVEIFDNVNKGDAIILYTDGIDNNKTPDEVAKELKEAYDKAMASGNSKEDAFQIAMHSINEVSVENMKTNPEGKYDNTGMTGYLA